MKQFSGIGSGLRIAALALAGFALTGRAADYFIQMEPLIVTPSQTDKMRFFRILRAP